jgi:hypothetical protein
MRVATIAILFLVAHAGVLLIGTVLDLTHTIILQQSGLQAMIQIKQVLLSDNGIIV